MITLHHHLRRGHHATVSTNTTTHLSPLLHLYQHHHLHHGLSMIMRPKKPSIRIMTLPPHLLHQIKLKIHQHLLQRTSILFLNLAHKIPQRKLQALLLISNIWCQILSTASQLCLKFEEKEEGVELLGVFLPLELICFAASFLVSTFGMSKGDQLLLLL